MDSLHATVAGRAETPTTCRGRRLPGLLLALLGLLSVPAGAETATAPHTFTEMAQRVAAASRPSPPWTGPTTGPAAVGLRLVAVVCEDLRNGGVLGVAEGIREAAAVIGWRIRVYDAGGTAAGRQRSLDAAFKEGADGLVLVGSDAAALSSALAQFAKRGIPIVGWHVGPKAGPMTGAVAVNVSTDPIEVAHLTAMATVVESRGKAGVVIFTDSNFAIATAKSDAMAAVIRACPDCTLLAVQDLPISASAQRMPALTRELLAKYGEAWSYGLAINDIYFDYASPELTKAGRTSDNLKLLSAGDGSSAAFLRIHAGAFQTGTVAEPLTLQGWQLVDELNRLFAGRPVTGYAVPVHLVTPDNIDSDGGPDLRYDPDNGYRDVFTRIWRP